jgi:hypothetical protein
MAVEWTDELKQRVIDEYVKADPTPENSADIVNEIAQDIDATPNGVRLVLSKAGVYVKKTAAKSATTGGSTKEKSPTSTRVSKADAMTALEEAISSKGMTPNSEILEKMTGKAMQYFTEVIKSI